MAHDKKGRTSVPAKRAAVALRRAAIRSTAGFRTERIAQIIDKETKLPELIEMCDRLIGYVHPDIRIYKQAKILLSEVKGEIPK